MPIFLCRSALISTTSIRDAITNLVFKQVLSQRYCHSIAFEASFTTNQTRLVSSVPLLRSEKFESKKEETLPAPTQNSHSIVLKQKIPKDFVKNTYLPHLEDQIASHTHTLNPSQIVPLVCAYGALPEALRHSSLSSKLAEAIKFRISGFRVSECVGILHPMFKVQPNDTELFQCIADHLMAAHIFKEISTLEIMGIYRIYSKLSPKLDGFTSLLLPRLQEEIAKHDAVELCDILVSIADHACRSGTAKDVTLLKILLPEIEKKYSETSLLHIITILNSLCKLQIFHTVLLERATIDFSNAFRIRNLPPKYIARLCWVYSRFGKLSEISHALYPLIEGNVDNFNAIQFARLCQSLPEDSNILIRICIHLQKNISQFSRSEFSAFFLGCVRRKFFPLQDSVISSSDKLAVSENRPVFNSTDALIMDINKEELRDCCIGYINAEQENFKKEEIIRFVFLLKNVPDFVYLLNHFPSSWLDAVDTVLD